MFRDILNAFGLGADNRFADWPAPVDHAPSLNLSERAVGPLRFGASIEEARALGRPDACKQITPTTTELLHARLGLLLQFDDTAGLDYLAFLIAPDRHDPRHAKLRHQPVHLSTGAILTAQSTEPELVRIFGVPREIDRDEEETVLHHVSHGLRIECELTPSGTLKRLNVFPSCD